MQAAPWDLDWPIQWAEYFAASIQAEATRYKEAYENHLEHVQAMDRDMRKAEKQLAEARAQEGKLWKLLKDICRNAYACHFQQGESESDPCRQCANCRADNKPSRFTTDSAERTENHAKYAD